MQTSDTLQTGRLPAPPGGRARTGARLPRAASATPRYAPGPKRRGLRSKSAAGSQPTSSPSTGRLQASSSTDAPGLGVLCPHSITSSWILKSRAGAGAVTSRQDPLVTCNGSSTSRCRVTGGSACFSMLRICLIAPGNWSSASWPATRRRERPYPGTWENRSPGSPGRSPPT
jgi:hypothetical protein